MEQKEFDAFSVFFWENSVRVGEQTYPLGQATVDVLNFPSEDFSRLCDLTEAFGRAYDRLLDQRDKRMAEDVQAKFNAALDAITTLPPYRDLKLDAGSRTFLLDLREMPEEWGEATRTCRKVGAHAKEKREREEASPVQREYQRTYNRLKQQHQRRKKDDTEYNRQVAQAQDIRDAYARGALGEEGAIARLIAIK